MKRFFSHLQISLQIDDKPRPGRLIEIDSVQLAKITANLTFSPFRRILYCERVRTLLLLDDL